MSSSPFAGPLDMKQNIQTKKSTMSSMLKQPLREGFDMYNLLSSHEKNMDNTWNFVSLFEPYFVEIFKGTSKISHFE